MTHFQYLPLPSIEEPDRPTHFPRTPYPYHTSSSPESTSGSSSSPTGHLSESSSEPEELALSPEKEESAYEPEAAGTPDLPEDWTLAVVDTHLQQDIDDAESECSTECSDNNCSCGGDPDDEVDQTVQHGGDAAGEEEARVAGNEAVCTWTEEWCVCCENPHCLEAKMTETDTTAEPLKYVYQWPSCCVKRQCNHDLGHHTDDEPPSVVHSRYANPDDAASITAHQKLYAEDVSGESSRKRMRVESPPTRGRTKVSTQPDRWDTNSKDAWPGTQTGDAFGHRFPRGATPVSPVQRIFDILAEKKTAHGRMYKIQWHDSWVRAEHVPEADVLRRAQAQCDYHWPVLQ